MLSLTCLTAIPWAIWSSRGHGSPASWASRRSTPCADAGSGLPALLHREFRLQACDVALDRGYRQHTALALVARQAVPLHDVAVDIDLVPGFGVTDIIDRHVVMLAPEERHRIERLARAQHVARRGLALAFRHHPMLDPDIFFRMRIGPARDIAGGKDAGNAAFEEFIHRDATVEFQAGRFGQGQARTHADADHD